MRKPAKLGTRGKKFPVAGATAVGAAIAVKAANILLLIFVAIVGIIAYSSVAPAALNPGMRGNGCGTAGSGGHAPAAGFCGASGGDGGGGEGAAATVVAAVEEAAPAAVVVAIARSVDWRPTTGVTN